MAENKGYYVSDFRYTGGMDYDSALLAVNKGDCITALNISRTNTQGQGDNSFFQVNGNLFEFALPTVTTQNKIYAIQFENSTGVYLAVQFLNLNGSLFPTNTAAIYLTTGTLSTDTTDFGTAIGTALTNAGYTNTIVSSTPGTVLVTITQNTGFDYDIISLYPGLVVSLSSATAFSVGGTITDSTTSEVIGVIAIKNSTTEITIFPLTGNTLTSGDTITDGTHSVTTSGVKNTFPVTITVIQEAIDGSITYGNSGICLPIGGIDYLDDLFIFSTCQTEEPQTLNITAIADSSGFFKITVSGNQTATGTGYIQNGFYVNIAGVIPTAANGLWEVASATYSSPNTTFILYNSTYVSGYSSGGTVTSFVEGYLSVTVNQKNKTTGVWTTTQLLGTKAIDSRFYNPIRKEINANTNNNIKAIYFTDNAQPPLIFEYTGAYMNNGAILYYNPLGQYTYEDVGEETINIIPIIPPIVKVTGLIDGGGAVPSGGWSYTVQPLDSDLTAGNAGILTQPINIYNGSTSNPGQIVGTVGENSAFQVVIEVTEIPEGFAYLNLIGVNYQGDAENAYIIKRVPIPPDATSVSITHTGLETPTDYTSGFDLSSLSVKTAGTQTICSNTLLYANLTTAQINDFTAATQNITHVMNVNTTILQPTGDDRTGFTYGEYQNPFMTENNVSGMLNETYRIWFCYLLKSGVYTQLFFVDDIRFDAYSTNRANPFGNNNRVGNNITSYDLSPSPANVTSADINSYVFYVTLNINNAFMSQLIDGVPMSELVERIYVFRSDNSVLGLNEVLGCGLTVRHVGNQYVDPGNAPTTINGVGYVSGKNYLFDNPLLPTGVTSNSTIWTYQLPPLSNGQNTYATLFGRGSGTAYTFNNWGGDWATYLIDDPTTYSGSFYCPDVIYGQANIQQQSSDSILNYGAPYWYLSFDGGTYMDEYSTEYYGDGTNNAVFIGSEIRLSGSTGVTNDPYDTSAINLPLQFVADVPLYSSNQIVNPDNADIIYCPSWVVNNAPVGGVSYTFTTSEHLWLYTNSEAFTNTGTGQDIGLYYCQYYRDLGSATASANAANYPNNTKFGAITTGQGIPTGAYIDASSITNISTLDVYGFDTFTQKSFMRITLPNPDTNSDAIDTSDTGGGVTVVFFCQNRMNYNMRDSDPLGYPNPTPQVNWIQDTSDAVPEFNYDTGYTPRNPDDTLDAFDPAIPIVTVLPEEIIYSLVQPQNAVTNNFRIFPPLNFYDLSSDKGYITNISTIQGELFSLQQKTFLRLFYNEVGTMDVGEPSTPTQVSLGSGAPFTKPPYPIVPDIGNSNNHGLLVGEGVNGETLWAWIDIISKQVVIASKSGFEIVSLTKKMRTFFYQNLGNIIMDNPSLQNGITGCWDDKRKQFVWTVFNTPQGLFPWNGSDTYTEGSLVTYGSADFNGVIPVYEATEEIQPDMPPPNNGWKLYQQYYTIVYSIIPDEKGNTSGRFTTFLSPAPYFYVEWANTYLTAYPTVTYNGIYEDDLGAVGIYYINGMTSLSVNGSLSFPTNEYPDVSKLWQGIWFNSNIIPYYLLFTTQECSSYLPNTDQDWQNENNDAYYNAIQLDTLTAPNHTPQEDSTPMYGSYLVTTITFLANTIQNVYKVILKWKPLSRTPNN